MKLQIVKQITRKIIIFAFFALLGLSSAAESIAQNSLDPAFGSGGKITTDVSGVDFGNNLALQPDGKIIVAGAANASGSPDFAVVRYNTNGLLDASFGSGGKVVTDFGGGSDSVNSVALQPDGKIVAAGASGLNFALARYNSDGSLDTTFGTGGRVTTDFFGFADSVGAVVVQPDGKIVAAGRVGRGSTNDFGLSRYNSDGSLDTSFGSGGRVSTDFNGQTEFLFALVLQSGGKLIAAGVTGSGSAADFALARYNSDGSLDAGFGSGGRVTADFAGGYDQANSLALQADGKILAAGGAGNDFALARYNADGSLDVSFGSGGKTVTDFAGQFDVVTKVLVLASGKIAAVGEGGASGGGTSDFALAGYNANGSLDATFGASGKITTDFGGRDSALGAALQPDGKIVAAGYSANASFTVSDFALARYLGASTAGCPGNRKTVGVFRPSNGITYLRNSNTGGFADISMVYGVNGDTSFAGDWNGDRVDTLGIYRNGVFYLRNSNTTGPADIVFAFGSPGDQPIAGDWNGDGIDTIGVYRQSTGVFLLRNSNTSGAPDLVFVLGNPGDVAIAGDWNGDCVTTTGVFRPTNGIVYLKNANTTGDADIGLVYGVAGDKPLAGDWDGDGFDSIGIYREGVFYLRNSNTQGFADLVFALGNPGDEPVAGDWDGLP